MILNKVKYDDIIKELKKDGQKISLSRISGIKKSIMGFLSVKRGKIYEKYCYENLKTDPKYENWDVKWEAGPGEPDIYLISPDQKKLIVLPIKCYDIERDNYTLPISEFNPEIDFCLKNHRKYDSIKLIAWIYNHTDLKRKDKPINYIKPPKTIKVK